VLGNISKIQKTEKIENSKILKIPNSNFKKQNRGV
jgi:hypothetical protein